MKSSSSKKGLSLLLTSPVVYAYSCHPTPDVSRSQKKALACIECFCCTFFSLQVFSGGRNALNKARGMYHNYHVNFRKKR